MGEGDKVRFGERERESHHSLGCPSSTSTTTTPAHHHLPTVPIANLSRNPHPPQYRPAARAKPPHPPPASDAIVACLLNRPLLAVGAGDNAPGSAWTAEALCSCAGFRPDRASLRLSSITSVPVLSRLSGCPSGLLPSSAYISSAPPNRLDKTKLHSNQRTYDVTNPSRVVTRPCLSAARSLHLLPEPALLTLDHPAPSRSVARLSLLKEWSRPPAMEAAAKTVESLTQRILPEKPHHLSYSAQWRYRPRPDDSKRFEEWHNTRLQYLTLVSEADRGVLLTRSYYDMREEPPKPSPREVSALAKTSDKKKLSLSDYKNKKTVVVSASPPEPSIAKKRDTERAAASFEAAATATSSLESRSATESRSSLEVRKPDRGRSRDRDQSADGKLRPPRDNIVDMRLPPKPPTKHPLPPRPPSPSGKKRVADIDDELRPQKRSKAERFNDDRFPAPRDDTQKRKDRAPPASNARDPPPHHRDERPSSSLPNGRTIMKSSANLGRNASPASRPRADSINGNRPTITGNSRITPTKTDTSSKSFVPPLLSPLNLALDDRRAGGRSPPPPKGERKKREEVREGARSPKHRKSEALGGSKRQRSPLRLPPLLSPTLPPAVEAALQLGKKPSPELADDRIRDDKESLKKTKKPQMEYSDEDEPISKSQRKTFIVLLKISKRWRKDFTRMMALSGSMARKEAQTRAQSQDHEPEEVAAVTTARKRPAAAADAPSETAALKRPRASDMSASTRLPAPSTPSKKGPTNMSRVSSSNSLAQTPGEAVNATPLASGPGPLDRRTNGHDASKVDRQERPERPEARAMREKEMRFSTLGRRLKHDADLAMKGRRSPHAANGKSGRDPSPKLGYVVSLESILAFMMGFQAQNMHRWMCNKKSDPTGWASLFPFLEFLQKEIRRHEARRFQPLFALLLLLHATAIDELIKCYTALENPAAHISLPDLLRHERLRTRAWPQIREVNASIENVALRLDLSPWATLDEITLAVLRILRRWCAEENVDWAPDPALREQSISKSSQN